MDVDEPLNKDNRDQSDENGGKHLKFWSFKSVRMHIATLLCLNFFVLTVMRDNLGVAMVCMVNKTAIEEEKLDEYNKTGNVSVEDIGHLEEKHMQDMASEEGCPVSEDYHGDYQGDFPWSSAQQGMLFAAVYWGSFSTLAAGWLSDRYSPKWVLLASGVLNVLSTVFIPVAAKYGGYPAMIAMRLIAGIGQGLERPSVGPIVARWYPVDERATVVSYYTSGNQLSAIATTPLFAWMCRMRHAIGGWPLIFYTSACLGVIWCILWVLFATNEPSKCRRISKKELNYISSKLGDQIGSRNSDAKKRIPWRRLLTSMPVIACIVCGLANGMILSLAGSYVPTYFKTMLHMDLKSNGLFAALPFVAQLGMKFVAAAIEDRLLKKNKCKATVPSKIFNSIASFGTAGFLFGCSFVTCDHKPLAISLFCLALGFFGVFACGYWASMVNIAPLYAGIISSLATGSMTVGAIIAPYLVGGIVVEGKHEEWQLVFGIISGCLVFSGLFYIVFGSAEVQPWANEDTCENESHEAKKDAGVHGNGQQFGHKEISDRSLGRVTSEEKLLAK